MIVSQFIKAVYVYRDYMQETEFNVSFDQFKHLGAECGENRKDMIQLTINIKKQTCFCKSARGGPEETRTLDLSDANEPTGIVCTWIWPFLAVSANNHFVFKPLVTTIFRVFREPLWYVLWSASEPRWNAPARLVCCLRVDDTSERGVRQQFSAHSNARGAMLNQGIGRVLPCCGSSRKINSGNKIKNLKTGRIIDKLALLC